MTVEKNRWKRNFWSTFWFDEYTSTSESFGGNTYKWKKFKWQRLINVMVLTAMIIILTKIF